LVDVYIYLYNKSKQNISPVNSINLVFKHPKLPTFGNPTKDCSRLLSVLVFFLAVVAIRKVGAAVAVVVASIRNYDVPAFSEDRSPILVADYCGLGKNQLHLFSQIKRQIYLVLQGQRVEN
jgi:hypothetical protein